MLCDRSSHDAHDVVGACASLLAACASLCLDLVVPVQSYGLIFHWARIPCWCLDRIRSASEPSGSRGCIDGCIGHVGSQHAPWSYLRSSGDWTQGSPMRWYFPGRPERCSLLARFKLALPCEVPRRVSRSLGSRFWFKNTTRGTPWAVRPLALASTLKFSSSSLNYMCMMFDVVRCTDQNIPPVPLRTSKDGPWMVPLPVSGSQAAGEDQGAASGAAPGSARVI